MDVRHTGEKTGDGAQLVVKPGGIQVPRPRLLEGGSAIEPFQLPGQADAAKAALDALGGEREPRTPDT